MKYSPIFKTMIAVAAALLLLNLALGTVRGLCLHPRNYRGQANTLEFKRATTGGSFPFRVECPLQVREFALKSSASDQLGAAESLSIEIKAVRFKVDAVETCLRGNSTEIAHSTNIHVQTYKSLTTPQLLKLFGQLQDEKNKLQDKENKLQDKENKLLDKENKLLDLALEEKKNSRGSGGKASYLAFLVRLFFLNLVPC